MNAHRSMCAKRGRQAVIFGYAKLLLQGTAVGQLPQRIWNGDGQMHSFTSGVSWKSAGNLCPTLRGGAELCTPMLCSFAWLLPPR